MGKKPFRKATRLSQDNIKMGRNEIGRDDVVCIHLAQDRGRWRVVMNLRDP
jgi:hypothetical protein